MAAVSSVTWQILLQWRHVKTLYIYAVSQHERPRAVALASSACVDKTTKIITEFTRKDPYLRLKRVN